MNVRVASIKRNLHYDLLRILACVMVICIHAPMPHKGWYGPLLSGLSYLCAPSIGLFIMISGALLLHKSSQDNFDTRSFLSKRFGKILWPTLFWYALGYILRFCGIPNGEYGVIWFMFMLSGLYLLVPILSRWLRAASRKEVEFYLTLWCVTLCYPFFKLFFKMNEGTSSWIYYFNGFVGYFVLGYYLTVYPVRRSFKIGLYILFALLSIAFPAVSLLFHFKLKFYSFFWYLSLSVVLQCIVWWFFAKRVSHLFEPARSVIEFLSRYSFGVYLVHILILRKFIWQIGWIQSLPGYLQIIVCVVLTYVLSLLACWCISKSRVGKYIIGV